MQQITSIEGLSCHTNIEVYQCSVHHNSKNIILYDDHRSILNVLFEVKKLNLFSKVPNLIFFDRHDDACNPNISAKDLLEKWNVKTIEEVSSRDFWSFVEFDLGGLDDDWLLAGMELGLINNAVVIGQNYNGNIKDMNYEFQSSDNVSHDLFDIPHLNSSLDCRGFLGDSISNNFYEKIRDIFEYNNNKEESND